MFDKLDYLINVNFSIELVKWNNKVLYPEIWNPDI